MPATRVPMPVSVCPCWPACAKCLVRLAQGGEPRCWSTPTTAGTGWSTLGQVQGGGPTLRQVQGGGPTLRQVQGGGAIRVEGKALCRAPSQGLCRLA
eukprot:360351-Chlamydomonas_euryale.AAC.1